MSCGPTDGEAVALLQRQEQRKLTRRVQPIVDVLLGRLDNRKRQVRVKNPEGYCMVVLSQCGFTGRSEDEEEGQFVLEILPVLMGIVKDRNLVIRTVSGSRTTARKLGRHNGVGKVIAVMHHVAFLRGATFKTYGGVFLGPFVH